VALPAFAAAPRAAARLLLNACAPAVQQSTDVFCPPGPQQQTRNSSVRWPDGTDGRTDGRTLDSCIDPAPHTVLAAPITTFGFDIIKKLRYLCNGLAELYEMWYADAKWVS